MRDSEKKLLSNSRETRTEGQPLGGKTVMVTRARAQSKEITQMMERLGATVIHCPTIEVIEPSSWAALDAAIERIDAYDWIVFTSANGPEYFYRRLAALNKDAVSSMARLTVCAIGPATARAIESAGVRVDVVATDSKAEGATCGRRRKAARFAAAHTARPRRKRSSPGGTCPARRSR
jgi:uroporphyrinogen III methyltransferase/synthase